MNRAAGAGERQSAVIFIGHGDYTGAARMGLAFGKALVEHGSDVLVIVGDPPDPPTRSVTSELESSGISYVVDTGFKKFFDPALVRRCVSHCRSIKPIVLISMCQCDVKIAAAVSAWLGVPLVISAQNVTTFSGTGLARALRKELYGLVVRVLGSRIVCTSNYVREQYSKEFSVDRNRLEVLDNGIEMQGLSRVHNRIADLGECCENEIRLLNVGRLDEQKAQHILLNALSLVRSRYPQVKLFLVGEPTIGSIDSEAYAIKLKKIVSDLGLDDCVIFLGWRDDVVQIQIAVDIYVHSAIWEGPPLTLSILESMGCGTPVVFTDCVGVPDAFENGRHGLIVRAGDPESLANGILRMCEMSKAERVSMGVEGMQYVRERFDIGSIGRAFCRIVDITASNG